MSGYRPEVSDDLPPGERPMVAVVRAVPGHEDRLAAAITTLTAAVRREPGCREFRSFRDFADPGVFHRHSTSDAGALVELPVS